MVAVVRIIFEGAAMGEEHLGSGETAALVQESGIPGRGGVRKVSSSLTPKVGLVSQSKTTTLLQS